ncbi:MAG: sugar ABC transporter permease, partial [Pseudobutyrivibrio sp.]|nr:sugar ABC transporter permease [Pseudobutyrivibrio sp.]
MSKTKAASDNNAFVKAVMWLLNDIKDIGVTFVTCSWATKLSYIIMGFGHLIRKQFARGLGFLAVEAGIIYYLIAHGSNYLKDFNTLGTTLGGFDENYVYTYGDNSFFILLYSLLSIFLILILVVFWRINIKDNKNCENLVKEGKKLPSSREDLASLLDEKFHVTLLAIPVVGVFIFLVLPIAFMICVAFTNYDYNHQAPTNLFTWVGLENFKNLFSFSAGGF